MVLVQKLPFFKLFFSGNIGQGNVFYEEERRNGDACYVKTSVGSLYSLLPFRCFVLFQHLTCFILIAFIIWHLFNHTRRRRFWWHCGGACDMVSILFFFPQQCSTRVSLENNFFIKFYFLFLLSFYLTKKWQTLLTTGIAKPVYKKMSVLIL